VLEATYADCPRTASAHETRDWDSDLSRSAVARLICVLVILTPKRSRNLVTTLIRARLHLDGYRDLLGEAGTDVEDRGVDVAIDVGRLGEDILRHQFDLARLERSGAKGNLRAIPLISRGFLCFGPVARNIRRVGTG
jgi:hypothetical protein